MCPKTSPDRGDATEVRRGEKVIPRSATIGLLLDEQECVLILFACSPATIAAPLMRANWPGWEGNIACAACRVIPQVIWPMIRRRFGHRMLREIRERLVLAHSAQSQFRLRARAADGLVRRKRHRLTIRAGAQCPCPAGHAPRLPSPPLQARVGRFRDGRRGLRPLCSDVAAVLPAQL